MRYCPKCKNLNEDTALRCSQCGSRRVRVVQPDDWVLIATATEYEAGKIEEALQKAEIPCQKQPAGVEGIPSMYNSDALYSDQNLCVPYRLREEGGKIAQETQAKTAAELEEMRREVEAQSAPKEGEAASPVKKFFSSVVAVLVFIALVACAVFFADWLGGILRNTLYGACRLMGMAGSIF